MFNNYSLVPLAAVRGSVFLLRETSNGGKREKNGLLKSNMSSGIRGKSAADVGSLQNHVVDVSGHRGRHSGGGGGDGSSSLQTHPKLTLLCHFCWEHCRHSLLGRPRVISNAEKKTWSEALRAIGN